MTPRYTPLQQVENVLGALALSLVWLVPNHQLPWSAFHHELVMAVVLGLCALVLAWKTPWRVPLSLFAGVLGLLVLLPWGQWAGGLIPKAGTAAVSSAYVAAVALAFVVGHAARLNGHRRVVDLFFAALAVAAVLNVTVQWIQWMQWYSSDFDSLVLLLVTPINEKQRPSGMILQPNQLATLQVWGLIGLTWFRHHRMLTLPLFVLLFAWIGVGLGLTQSRTALLEMVLVLALLAGLLKSSVRPGIVLTWAAGLALLIAWNLHFKDVASWLGIQQAAEARLTAVDGARLDGWRAFGAAILDRPWTGYGLTDAGHAYIALADRAPELYIGLRFGHAHNALLDLFLWVGLPLGLLLLGALSVWVWRRFRELPQVPDNVFPLALLGAFGVHAMLELPHQFLYFLVPAALFAGWLMPAGRGMPAITLPRPAWGAAGALTLAVATLISIDYFPYQERYTEWRFENNRVGKRPDIEVHAPRVLNQIHDELVLYRLPLRASMTPDELAWIADTARSVNSPPALYAAAKAHALANQPAEARVWMMRYNAIMGENGVRTVQAIWARDQAAHPELVRQPWPDYAGRRSSFKLSPDDAGRNDSLVPNLPDNPPASTNPR